ncbi:histidine phosphatase family protein [Georgenia sp. 311]|uniref:histidine phosphatase family protein n=1 Tax=Georgenia sp. 311 TaxID=2585134 RepID=UPI0011120EE5|nr:histidine phosphatase family protein [Georgenia sp. 311]TNC19449.1 histidine phosphatase family protein [Georgenia sp. 311]
MRLILIRHGQTSSNVGGLLDTGEPGAHLTELGREQAAAVARTLADERIDAVYASTLVRTQQTAEPLLAERGLELRVRDGIREISAGDLEMRGDDEAVRAYVGTIFGWAQDPDRRLPGGESGHEVWQRYDDVVAEAHAEGVGTAVMFSHGAVIRSWTAVRAENVTAEHAAYNPLSNTGVVVLEGSPREGWWAHLWEGEPLGGERVEDTAHDGPAAEPAPHAVGR